MSPSSRTLPTCPPQTPHRAHTEETTMSIDKLTDIRRLCCAHWA
jgi:hypothetical protein